MPALAGFDSDGPSADDDALFGLPADPQDDNNVMPPWAQPQEEDVGMARDDDSPRDCLAQRKQGAFMAKTDGPVTRQQALEYINLQRWAREGCSTFIYVSILWLSFLLLVDLHSHINVSYDIYAEVTKEVRGLVAKDTRGIAPNAIFSAAGESMCSCTCPALCGQTIAGGESLPGVPKGAPLFNGTVLPEQLQTMRAKAQFLRNLGQAEKIATLGEVNDIPDVWFWLQHGLVPELWHEEHASSPVDTTMLFGSKAVLASAKSALSPADKPGHFMRWNQVIGGVRLRQRRLHVADCRADNRIANAFNQRCHKNHDSVVPFGPGTSSYAEGFVPDETERGAFDIYLDTEQPVHMALETLQFMLKAHSWLDASSKTLQVQVPILNLEATPAMYGLLEIRFGFTRTGELTKKVDLWTAAANPYYEFSIAFVSDVVWAVFLVYLFWKKLFQAFRYFTKKRERHDILCNFWYLFDWATLICGLCIVFSWLYIVQETAGIGDAVTSLGSAPPFDAAEALIKSYHAKWGDILDRILWLTVLRERLRLAQFGYSMMLIFQFMKAFRGQPKLAQLTRTLINAFEDLTHFAACFVVLFLSFAFTGHLVYGVRLEDWSTSTKCVNAAFRALRGDLDLPGMYEIAPVTTMVWFWCFLVLNIFIMMNLLLATVFDHYQLVKGKANAFTGVILQAKDAWRDLWHREGFKIIFCSCCCRCRRRDDFPSHSEMVEELMARAGYNPIEKHHVFRTVLGPKWMRKKTEKHVFAGEVSAEHIKLDELAPAMEDFKQLGYDQDYCMSLLADAENYRDREFDPEEIHVNQMRELVTLAEIEMAAMRRRLDNCQGHMRLTMHDLARRLESLERATHKSLADLVYLAGAAGVPDRTEHESQLESNMHVAKPSKKSKQGVAATYQRVMQHLGQGMVQKLTKERESHQSQLGTLHNARAQCNTYARIHSNARLAHAFGEEEMKRVARKHAMHV